jgi:acetyltransferase
MQDCVSVYVKSAIIISAGFKETGPEGALLENEIMEIARGGNMRVIGPNCLGVMVSSSLASCFFSQECPLTEAWNANTKLKNPINGLNATFATQISKPGNVAFISQSGAMVSFDLIVLSGYLG